MDHEQSRFTTAARVAIGCAALSAARRPILALLLLGMAVGAHAGSMYRCTDAHGQLAYQDTPCAARASQRKIDVQPLPTIGDPGEAAARARAAAHDRATRRARRPRATHPAHRRARVKPLASWECRAADGEVFYRHTRCPSSVPGDGTVRIDYAERTSREYPRRHHNAWSRVRVHGVKVSRDEACRRIHSAGASGRDGHLRDEAVSTYDHLMGRDPCDNG